MGCHFLLRGIFPTQGSNTLLLSLLHWQVGSLRHHLLSGSCSRKTLWDPMGYTVYGILQATILEWVAFPFCRGSLEYKCSSTRKKTEILLKGSLSIFYQANLLLFSFNSASQGGSEPPGMVLQRRSWLSRLGWQEGLRPCRSEDPQ